MEEKKKQEEKVNIDDMDRKTLESMAYRIMKNMSIFQRELQMIETKINQLEKNAVQM